MIEYRSGFGGGSLERHLSIRGGASKAYFGLISGRFTGVDGFGRGSKEGESVGSFRLGLIGIIVGIGTRYGCHSQEEKMMAVSFVADAVVVCVKGNPSSCEGVGKYVGVGGSRTGRKSRCNG